MFRTFDEKKTVASAGVRPFLNTMAAMAWLAEADPGGSWSQAQSSEGRNADADADAT